MPLTLSQRLHAGDLFHELNPEESGLYNKFQVKRNSELQEIIGGFERVLRLSPTFFRDHSNLPLIYEVCRVMTPDSLSIERINHFCLLLPDYQEKENFPLKAGIYITSLINKVPEQEVWLNMPHLDFKVSNFGLQNDTKIVNVNGDLGTYTGNSMKSGKIKINGNTGNFLGSHMEGGEIEVNGDAGDEIGYCAQDGKIVITGRAGSIAIRTRFGTPTNVTLIVDKKPIIIDGGSIK